MLELVPDNDAEMVAPEMVDTAPGQAKQDERPCATIHYLFDPRTPSLNAIISVARRLQEVLLEHGAIAPDQPLPFPALAPIGSH